MLPERAFQPRGPYGMTLEGGGGGIVGAIGDVFQGAVDVVKDVGSFIDDKVIQPIVKDPISAIATTVGAVVGGPVGAGVANTVAGLVQGESPEEAIKGGVVSGLTVGAGQSLLGGTPADSLAISDSVYQGASGTVPASVPSAFDTAVSSTLGGGSTLGQFGQAGTAGFGTALPPASDVAAGLTSAGFAPGTAANIAGQTAAGIGATNLLGGATAAAPLIPKATLSLTDALRGARLVSGLLTPQQQQQEQQQIANLPQGLVDYSQLLGLLAQRAKGTGLLGTQFQPQPLNLTSLLG